MAQHDYDIANASGASVRADINAVLLAIITQNSGNSAPTTTYPYMWWADTSNDTLKVRNSANTGWINIGNLTQAYLGLAPQDSPTLTGSPTAPTAAANTNTTQIATTAFVQAAAQAKVDAKKTITTVVNNSEVDGRKIYIDSNAPVSGDGANGDIWFEY